MSEEKVEKIVSDILGDSSIFLVDIQIKKGNNLKVFVDGDEGVSIDAIANITRSLRKQILDQQIFQEDDFSLEVSSPGVGKPLKLQRQYKKNIGRDVRVTLLDGNEIVGLLQGVEPDNIVVEKEVKGQKKVIKEDEREIIIPFKDIKSTVVEIKF